MGSEIATFCAEDQVYRADSCADLQAAAQRGDIELHALARDQYPGEQLPESKLPGLKTLGWWDIARPQKWGLPWHRNEGLELTFLAKGTLTYALGAQEHRLTRGMITVTRPWQIHRVGEPWVGPSRLFWLILDVGVRRPNQEWLWPEWLLMDPGELSRLATLLRQSEQSVWGASGEIKSAFVHLERFWQTPRPALSRIALHINELLVNLKDLLESGNLSLDEGLSSSQQAVKLFLESLPAQAALPWTLETMAEECGLGRSRFSEYCRQITNLSPCDYLNECRLAAAKRLLRQDPQRNITEIALACGFGSSQYFSTVFRKNSHMTPRQFRAQA